MCAYIIFHFDPEPLYGDQTEVSAEEFDSLDNPDFETYQDYGVLPSDLDQKLSHVLLEQQESQITELESKLHQSHYKLNDKEVELKTLKDCIRCLTEVSLISASGRFIVSSNECSV